MTNPLRGLTVCVLALFFVGCQSQTGEQAAEGSMPDVSAVPATPAMTNTEAATASNIPDDQKPAFEFVTKEHDFGRIKQGDKVRHNFKFTNVGKSPLVIASVQASCGCTTPNYPKTPVAPGDSGEITVEFDSSGKSGAQMKTVTINSNAKNGGVEVLTIRCEIDAVAGMIGPVKN
jgi:Protein of unknown function (DUF1573)